VDHGNYLIRNAPLHFCKPAQLVRSTSNPVVPTNLKALRVSAAYKSHRTAPQIEDGGGHPLQGLALAKLLDLLKNRKVARIPRLCNDVELAVELTDHGIVNVGKFFKTEFLPGNNGRDELFTFE